jgi:hypothetical protein
MAGAVGFQLTGMVSKFTDSGGEIDKAMQRIGISAERLQELRYAAKISGSSFETLDASLLKFNQNLANAAAGKNADLASLMKKLGIALKDANGNLRNGADLLPEFADAIKRNTDSGLRARMMVAAFGKAGTELIPMLAGGSEALSDMTKRAKSLGIVMSGEDVKAAAELGDRIDELGMVSTAFGNAISAKLSPVLSSIITKISAVFAKNKEAFSDRIAKLVENFALAIEKIDFEKVINGFFNFIEAAGKVFDSIGGFKTVFAVVSAIFAAKTVAGVMSFAGSLVTLVSTFSSLMPLLASVGVGLGGLLGPIAAVAAGAALIIANWDKLKPVFTDLVNSLSALFAGDLSGAFESFKNAASKVFDLLPERSRAVCQEVFNVWAALFSGDFAGAIDAFKNSVLRAFELLPQSWQDVCQKIFDKLTALLGDIMTAFINFFKNLDLGKMVTDSFKGATDFVSSIGKNTLESAKEIGRGAWKSVTDFFGGGDSAVNVQTPTSGGPVLSKQDTSLLLPQNNAAFTSMPVNGTQTVNGAVNVNVWGRDGARAEVDGVQSSGPLSILGNVGNFRG